MRPAPHLAFLDGLRAVAALSVLVSHVAWFTPVLFASALYPLFYQGLRGVELFFVISGFCLSYPVIRSASEGGSTGLDYMRFLAKRFARILPPYYVALALMALASLTPQWHFMESHLPWKETVPAHLRALSGLAFLDRGPLLNGSFWTLGIEFRWYLLFPVVLALFMRSPVGLMLLAGACWIAGYATSLHSIDLDMFPAFFLGIFAAALFVANPPWLRWAPHAAIGLVGLAVIITPFSRGPLWELAAFAFVVVATRPGPVQRLLSTRVLVALGVASYSIYLVHQPVVAWLAAVRVPALVTIGVGTAVGYAFWWMVERPLTQPAVRNRLVAFFERYLRLGVSAVKRVDAPFLSAISRVGRVVNRSSRPAA